MASTLRRIRYVEENAMRCSGRNENRSQKSPLTASDIDDPLCITEIISGEDCGVLRRTAARQALHRDAAGLGVFLVELERRVIVEDVFEPGLAGLHAMEHRAH